ncbi:MAG: hypothetical protein SGILL_007172 [Bacillariaceae sp.]
MEETLYSLNQAFDSTAAAADSEIHPPYPEYLPSPRTTAKNQESVDDSYGPTNREHSTSLDLFNENMAKLFQDVGVNDTREIPILEEETLPLTTSVNLEASKVEEDGSMGRMSDDLRVSQDIDLNDSQLDGEGIITSTASSRMGSSHMTPHSSRRQGDVESGMSNNAFSAHDVKMESIRDDYDVEAGASSAGTVRQSGTGQQQHKKRKRKRSVLYRCLQRLGIIQNVDDFIRPRRQSIVKFLIALWWLATVAIGVAAILFYLAGNSPTGIVDLEASAALNGTFVTTGGEKIDPLANASHSWWILYACVRLPITFALARFLQSFCIDFLILERRCIAGCMGPTMTLLLVQAKGWPATLFFWAVCNLGLLYGDSRFVAHWGYWQSYVEVFNEANPQGSAISSNFNLTVQLCALGVSIVVAVKRLLIGFYQGRKIFLTYAEDLSKLLSKMLIIREVVGLAVRLETEMLDDPNGYDRINESLKNRASTAGIDAAAEKLNQDIEEEDDENDEKDGESSSLPTSSNRSHPSHPSKDFKSKRLLISEADKEYVTGRLSPSQKRRVERLLGNWEEPETESVLSDAVSIGSILQFRASLSRLDTNYPFAVAFGRANNRNACIESSQSLYLRLVDSTADGTLNVSILGLIALQRNGRLDQEKLKSLIRTFRPGKRDGVINMIDFVKSIVSRH